MGGRGRTSFGGLFGTGGAFDGFSSGGFGINSKISDLGQTRRPNPPNVYNRQTGGGGGGGTEGTTTRAAAAPTPPVRRSASAANVAAIAREAEFERIRVRDNKANLRAERAATAGGGGGEGGRSSFTSSLEKEFGIGKAGRDANTKSLWNGKFEIDRGTNEAAINSATKNLFGKTLGSRDLALLVGAPDKAQVSIEASLSGNIINVKFVHPAFVGGFSNVSRTIRKDSSGKLFIHNDHLSSAAKGSSGAAKFGDLGGRQLTISSAVTRRLGVKYIDTNAAGQFQGSSGLNGYYTWSRVGFNQKLSNLNFRSGGKGLTGLPAHLKTRKDLNGLFRFDAVQRRLGHSIDKRTGTFTSGKYAGQISGGEYWKKNGAGNTLVFDLSPKSASQKILAYWNKEKGISSATVPYGRGRKIKDTDTPSKPRRKRAS